MEKSSTLEELRQSVEAAFLQWQQYLEIDWHREDAIRSLRPRLLQYLGKSEPQIKVTKLEFKWSEIEQKLSVILEVSSEAKLLEDNILIYDQDQNRLYSGQFIYV